MKMALSFLRCASLGMSLGASLMNAPAHAQQSMPGMNMPMPAQPMPQAQPKPQTNTQTPRYNQRPETLPPNASNRNARQARASVLASEAQQRGAAAIVPAPASDFTSFSWDTLRVQEPESIDARQQLAGGPAAQSAQPPQMGFLTGKDMPAPELLGDVPTRTPMGVDAFLALADRQNPTLAEMRAAAARSRAQATQVHLQPDPVIGYSGDHMRGGSYGGGEQGAFVQQDVVLWGKLGLRRDVYASEARENEIGTEEQRARVHNSVEQAFYAALTAQATAVVQQRLLRTADDAAETAHQLLNLGQADASNVLESEVAADQARIEYEHAQRDFLAAFSVLAAYAGDALPATPLVGAVTAPPAMDAQAAVSRVVAESPAVRRAQEAVTTAQARLKEAKREAAPDLSLKAGEWYSGEQIEGPGSKKTGPMSFAEAGLRVPVFNRNQGNRDAARAEVERAQADVLRVQLNLRQMAAPLAEQYDEARSEAERYRVSMLPRARRAYQLDVLKYQQMASPYTNTLASQSMLFHLQLAYLHALEREWQAAVSLQNFVLADALAMPQDTGSHDTMLNVPGR